MVAVTGWSQDEDGRAARRAGLHQHPVKPVTPRDLRATLSLLAAR